MKKLILTFLVSTMIFSLFGCETDTLPEENPVETTAETAAVTTEATTTVITAGPPETEVTTEVPVTAIKPEPQEDKTKYVEVSKGNEFIDFEYQKDYCGIKDRSKVKELAELAEKYLLENKGYKPEPDDVEFCRDYIDENGNIKPIFYKAIIEDLDGDKKNENFILMNMPEEGWPHNVRCYLFFINDKNEVELLNDYWFSPDSHKIEEISLLNYGKVKQLIIGSWGYVGVDGHFSLYGVKNDKPILHYEFRGQFIKYKCFLSGNGYHGYGSLMYYDTVENEYRIIDGEEQNLDEVLAMDTTNSLADIEKSKENYDVYLIGGKYYCFVDRTGLSGGGRSFTNEDGRFVRADYAVRFSAAYEDKKLVKNIDMNKAEAEMKKPERASYNGEASESEFIDFEYQYNYCGVRERSKVKAIADLAEKTVLECEQYVNDIAGMKEHRSAALAEYTAQYGEIKPKFQEAFIEDFDGDGKSESFVIVDAVDSVDIYCNWMDYTVLSYLIFVDSENNAEIVNNFYYVGDIVLLNYGKNKQLIIDSGGTCGANEHTDIMGMKDGKPITLYYFRGSYKKYGCFLNASGWQGSGDFMYFDTKTLKYKAIEGIPVDTDEVLAMDKTDSLNHFHKLKADDEYFDVRVFGGKYYNFSISSMDYGVTYAYENGRFIPADDMGIRRSWVWLDEADKCDDIDIDKAIAEMKKPY